MSDYIDSSEKKPNPQGKGCVPVLQDWAIARPRRPTRKSAGEIVRDYCLSGLVLASRFRFRPVPGKNYYLYCGADDWLLSMIAPHEWRAAAPGAFVADCHLRTDMTWQLEFAPLQDDSETRERLQRFVDGFVSAVAEQASPESDLPFYVPQLPYYQRMLATGLAVSLQHSIRETGPAALNGALPTFSLPGG